MGQTYDVATGITISFGTSGWTGRIENIRASGKTREAINISHQGTTTAHEFTPADLADMGEFVVDYQFNPATALIITLVAEEITITWPDDDTHVFTGFCTAMDEEAPLNEKMTGTMTIKVSGTIAI